MNRVVVTGIGVVSSLGNTLPELVRHLQDSQHGFSPFPARDGEVCPPKLYGAIKGFQTNDCDPESWTYPAKYSIPRAAIKGMAPHVLYSYCSTVDALADAGLDAAAVSDPMTGLYSASAGSSVILHHQLQMMNVQGVKRCSPFGVVAATTGTINFNLSAHFKIKGATCGMASACSSSAHALGFAYDAIATGRQERMLVIGAEDGNRESILPFAAMRALSTSADPRRASCPFDQNRSGFVGTGGAATLILESETLARARGANIYAVFSGWGQASDGHSATMSHPEGYGLERAMREALKAANVAPDSVDYVNAHATSTPVGDRAEMQALKSVFLQASGSAPYISSTKALSGHALSMAGSLEAGISCLAIKEGFMPGSAHIQHLDPACEGLGILQASLQQPPQRVLSNSSGFGGSNVALLFEAWPG